MILKKEKSQRITLSGNIVEIFNCDNERCSKILFHPGYIKINIESFDDAHLGDEFEIECDVNVCKSVPVFGTNKDRDE